MSNFPLAYKLSWLPRFLSPSLAGNRHDFSASTATLMLPPHGSVRLAFVGDISAVANHSVPTFDNSLRGILSSADLVIGNCESPVVSRPYAVVGTRIGTHHAMTERFLAATLDAAGIERKRLLLSLANNHMLDQGIAGFEETVAALKRLDIRTVGSRAQGPAAIVRIPAAGGLKIAFAAFTQWRNADAQAFVERVNLGADSIRGFADVAIGADLICAIPHWDWEFRHFPRPTTRDLASQLVAKGFGLIVGHHAHVVQPVEQIEGVPVAYGLGDFLGTAFSRQPWPGRLGAIFTADVSTDPGTRGRISSYAMHFFYRLREEAHERLVAVEDLPRALRQRVEERLSAIFPLVP